MVLMIQRSCLLISIIEKLLLVASYIARQVGKQINCTCQAFLYNFTSIFHAYWTRYFTFSGISFRFFSWMGVKHLGLSSAELLHKGSARFHAKRKIKNDISQNIHLFCAIHHCINLNLLYRIFLSCSFTKINK